MRVAPPRQRRAIGLQQFQPVLLVLGVVLLAGTFRLLEVHLFDAFKRAHVPKHFGDETDAAAADMRITAEEVDSLLASIELDHTIAFQNHAHASHELRSGGELMLGIEQQHHHHEQQHHEQQQQHFVHHHQPLQHPQQQQQHPAEGSNSWLGFAPALQSALQQQQQHLVHDDLEAFPEQHQEMAAVEMPIHNAPEHVSASARSVSPVRLQEPQREQGMQRRPEMPDTASGPGVADPVLERNFIVAEDDPNKCYTNHASSITQVGPGEFLASWFGGTDENAPDVAVWTSRYSGGRWGPVQEAVAPESRDHTICGKHLKPPVPCKWQNSTWNPVLYTLPDGEVLLFYKKGPHPSEWRGFLMRSSDRGNTWSPPARLPVMGPAKHKPIMLPSGVLLAGSSTESGRATEKRLWQCWIDASKDGGRTWERIGPVPFDGNIIQPSLWLGDDMNVHLLARTATDYDKNGKRADPIKNKKEMIYRGGQYLIHAKSDSTGLRWTTPGKPVFDLPSPNAAGDVVRLRDGRLLVIYNHSKERKALGRSTLLLAMSEDGGSKWKVVLELEDGPPGDPTQEFSYPSIIQAADNGLVHMTYTYRRRNLRHIVVDPTKLKPLPGKKFGKEYSGVKGHYDTSVLSSSMHHVDQQDSKSKRLSGGRARSLLERNDALELDN